MVQFLQLLEISPLDILPQRPPFVMIDRLACCDGEKTATRLAVRGDNLFVSGGRMLASGLLENIAQTCAARLGYFNLVSGLPVKIGFIGAVRNMHVARVPVVGETLDTTIRVREKVMGMLLADAEIRVAGEVIVSAEMKMAIQ